MDWEHEVPDLIDAALTHIAERYRAENAILANIRRARDDAEDPVRKRRAAQLVDIVGDCINRHTQLQARLLEATAVFRSEQDRQQFSGPARRAMVDLFGQLLLPTLELPVADAVRPTDRFFSAASGLAGPPLPRLLDLVQMLLTPAAERDDLAADVPEPDLVPPADPDVFSDEQWAWADELLDTDGVPRRLSGVLAAARRRDPGLPRLVALRVLHAVSPQIGIALRHGEGEALIAVDDGAALSDPEFGGADLLVGVARLTGPAAGAAPAATSDPDGAVA